MLNSLLLGLMLSGTVKTVPLYNNVSTPNLYESAVVSSEKNLGKYNKYACTTLTENGIEYILPMYGEQKDYQTQPVVLPSSILRGKSTTSPVSIVPLSSFWLIRDSNGNSQNLSFTHAKNQPVKIDGSKVILTNSLVDNGNKETTVTIETYSNECANILGSYLKTNAYQDFYDMKIDATYQQAENIINQMTSNSIFNNKENADINSQEFGLGEQEAIRIANIAGSVAYFNREDVFKEGNKLVLSGKISGSGMDLSGDISNLMVAPEGQGYVEASQGILYGFPPKPNAVGDNSQTVNQYQQEQEARNKKNALVQTPIKEDNSTIKSNNTSSPVNYTIPNTNNNIVANNQNKTNNTSKSLFNLSYFYWIIIGAVILLLVGILGFKIFSDFKKKRDYDDFPDI